MAFVDASAQGWILALADGATDRRLPACASPRGFSQDGSLLVLDGVRLCAGVAEIPPDAELSSRLIDVSTGEVILDFGPRRMDGASAAVFNPGGVLPRDRYLAAVIEAEVRAVEIYDLENGELISTPALAPMSLGFDPTGRYLIGGTHDERAFVLDLVQVVGGTPAEEALVFHRTVGTGLVPTVALNADGILATTIIGSPLRLWDIHTGQLVVELPVEYAIPQAAFSPDGNYLYYFDSSLGSVVLRRFPLDTEELIALAESRLTRGLTDDECQRYALGDTCPTLEELRGESAGS